MSKIVFILGGVRSGKSSFALELAKKNRSKTSFIATNVFRDSEMKARIKRHQQSRPCNWQTIEEGYDLTKTLAKIGIDTKNIVIDCLGVYVSNLMYIKKTDKEILENIDIFLDRILKLKNKIVYIVSNEVGNGVVPVSKPGRRFRDILGISNQLVAKRAKEAYLLVAGLPVKIK